MSSVGQAVGMIAGGVIGSFFGATMLGAAIGGAIGGYIDPPPGPKIEGPRLSDTQQQTSSYGAQISRIYANCATFCNVFWIENNALKEVSHTESQSAKGGSSAETTTYAYFGTFAAGICSVPIGESKTLGRIWLRGKLFYDPTDASLGAHFENGSAADYFTFYSGADDQLPDDRMQAALGISSTPAYRGLCYIVFKDLPLEEYGNSIVGTQIKIEVISSATVSAPARIVHVLEDLFAKWSPSDGPYNPRIENSIFRISQGSREIEIAANGTLISDTGGGSSGNFLIGTLGGSTVEFVLTGVATGDFEIGGVTFLQKSGGTSNEFQGAAVSTDGTRLYVLRYDASAMHLDIYDDGMSLLTSQTTTAFSYQDNIQYPYVPGSGIVFCVESASGVLWTANAEAYTYPVKLWQISPTGSTSAIGEINPPTSLAGTYGTKIAMAATDGLMYVASNGGSFSVYSRREVVTAINTTLGTIVSAECLASGLLESSDIDVTALTQEVRGYKVSNTASIRSAIDPLRACWPFDVMPSGYKIKFVPRGGSSVATIDSLELDARDGSSDNRVQITHSREMATQLPRRVEVTYIDADREYDIGPPGIAERTNTDATGVEIIELPIVLNADEGQAKAQTLLYLRWLERHDLSFVMPPTHLNIEVPDVVTITAPGATYLARLVEATTLPDGRIEAKAKLASTTIYTPNAVGQVGSDLGQSLVYGGPARMALLDIPCLTSAMDAFGMAVGMTGYYADWPGGTLVKSDDNWQSWQALEGFPAPGATIGTTTNALGAGRTDIKDASSSVNAWLSNSGMSSVTELQMFNGANHFAIGAHGRWEIIAAQSIVEQSDGSFTLSGMMRGRFGTEWAMTTHQAGDAIVHLDPTLIEFVGLPISALNIQKSYRAVSDGMLVSSATAVAFSWDGANIKPLPSCYLKGSRSLTTNDWDISWTPRTRTPVEPFSGAATPVGETVEAYDVEFFDSSYATLKRTVSGLSSPSVSYSEAEQITDFGAVQENEVYLRVHKLSSTFGRGNYLQGAVVMPPSDVDPYYAMRVLATRMNGADASTTFTDMTGLTTLTAGGNAKVTTSTYMVGDSAAVFDGTTDRIQINTANHLDWMHKGTESWTVVVRVRASVVDGTNYRTLLANFIGGAQNGIILNLNPNGVLGLNIGNGTAPYAISLVTGNNAVVQGTWHYLEFNFDHTLTNDKARIFVDGGLKATSSGNNAFSSGAANSAYMQIGSYPNPYAYGWIGNQQEMVIYRGVAIHHANYTPPALQFKE